MSRLSVMLLISAIAAALWLPNLFTHGMFMDGVINASVAKLYAEGVGGFFSLQEQYYANAQFVGHPPLVFAIQAIYFKLFGTAYYLDKLYGLVCALIQLLLICWLWYKLPIDKALRRFAWIPCTLWLLSPIVSWGYSSNLLENTMTLFTTLAIIPIVSYIHNGTRLVPMALVAAACTFAALLCKGPVAMFVLIAPMLLIGCHPLYTIKKALQLSLFYSGFLIVMVMSLWMLPESRAFIKAYATVQLQPALTSAPSAYVRLLLVPNLLKALSPLLVIVLATYFASWYAKLQDTWGQERKLAIRFIALGLCASLPIMLSNKQSAFYVIPSIPIFAIGFGLLISSTVEVLSGTTLAGKLSKGIVVVSVISIVVMLYLSINNYGTYLRDKEKLTDAEQVYLHTHGAHTLADPNYHFAQEYHFKAYLSRLYGMKVETSNLSQEWVISKESLPHQIPVYQSNWLYLYHK